MMKMSKNLSAITASIRTIASLKVVGLFFLLFLISSTVINGRPFGLAQLQKMTGGVSIPDMEMFGYTPQQAYDTLTAQGEAGRAFYLHNIIPQDFLFPLLYALFYATALTYLAQRLFPADHPLQNIGMFGLCAGLADWAENLCLLGLLLNFPQQLDVLARVASIFTVAKTFLVMLNMIMVLSGLGWILVKMIVSKLLPKAKKSKEIVMHPDIKPIILGGVNCYLLKSGDHFLLIDTGFSNKRSQLEHELERAGCRPGNLDLLIATHGDSDHVGNCAYLREKYGTQIAMHHSEVDAVKSGNPVLNKKIKHDLTGFMVSVVLFFFKLNKADRFEPDLLIDDGYALSEQGFDAQVLHLPGHSNGSLGVFTASGDLFCGDLLANFGKPAPGFGIPDSVGFASSIEKLKKLNIKTVYPGHGKPFAWEQFIKNNR
jgi:hydroxyacylglutathione hydrolase